MQLSERIKRWRKSREPQVTKSELARRVGVTMEAVIQWENGTTTPTQPNVERIADALGLTMAGFWGEPPTIKRKSKAS